MKILFFVQHLVGGGALRQLATLVPALRARGHDVSLVGLHDVDEHWQSLWPGAAESYLLGRGAGIRDAVVATKRLRRKIRAERPDVVYAYHGNVARLMAWLATRGQPTTLVWGQQGAGRTFRLRDGARQAVAFRLCAAVSPSVPLLISSSDRGRRRRAASRFRCPVHLTIPSSFDTDVFRRDGEGRTQLRAEWGIGAEPLVGLVGRIDAAHKGHHVFLQAASRLGRDIRFVLVGDGPREERVALEQLADRLGLSDRIVWAGFRSDMPAVYSALDVLCLASMREGLPNVVGEAMACGVPCVVTDVGDTAALVGDTGIVVPPDDPERLATGLATMLRRLTDVSPDAVRARIVERFSVGRWAELTEAALGAAAGSSPRTSSPADGARPAASAPRARSRP